MAQIQRTAQAIEPDAKKRKQNLQRAKTAMGGTAKAQGSQLKGGEIFFMPEFDKYEQIVGESDYNGSPWYWLRINASNGRTYKLSLNTFSKGLRLPENAGEVTQQNGKFAEIVEHFKYVLDAWLFCSWIGRNGTRFEWEVSVEEITELEWGSKEKTNATPTRVKSLNPKFEYNWEKGLAKYLEEYPETEVISTTADTNADDAV